MSKPFEVTDDLLDWLVDAVERGTSYVYMAARVGCCTDTVKRILHRHGIKEFEGAKYAYKDPPEMWSRPCNRCGDASPREKWLYFCTKCTIENNRPVQADGRERWYEYATPPRLYAGNAGRQQTLGPLTSDLKGEPYDQV